MIPGFTNASAETNFDNAIELQRNDSTDLSIPEKNALTTITDQSDSRIYKISLGMNPSEKVTLVSGKKFDIEITDPDGSTIAQATAIGGYNTTDTRQVVFPTSKVGDYYVEITPSTFGGTQYPYSLRVIVGEPIYTYGHTHKVNLLSSSITSSRTTSAVQYFDLSSVSTIPEDAVLTDIFVGGNDVNAMLLNLYSSKRSIRPNSTYTWIDAAFPLYRKGNLDYVPKSQQVRVKQRFAFKHSSSFEQSGTYTLTPAITLTYKKEMK